MPTLACPDLELHYEDTGAGAPAIVLRGWACDAESVAPLAAHLAQTRRVLVPDLRGHGRSGAPKDARYDVAAHADDVVALARAVGAARPLLVGHSLGAVIAVEAARALDAAALILIQPAAIVKTPEIADAMRVLTERLRADAPPRAVAAAELFLPTDEPDVLAAILATMLATPLHVVVNTYEQLMAYNGEPAARACAAPVLVIDAVRPVNGAALLRKVFPRLTAVAADVERNVVRQHRAARPVRLQVHAEVAAAVAQDHVAHLHAAVSRTELHHVEAPAVEITRSQRLRRRADGERARVLVRASLVDVDDEGVVLDLDGLLQVTVRIGGERIDALVVLHVRHARRRQAVRLVRVGNRRRGFVECDLQEVADRRGRLVAVRELRRASAARGAARGAVARRLLRRFARRSMRGPTRDAREHHRPHRTEASANSHLLTFLDEPERRRESEL